MNKFNLVEMRGNVLAVLHGHHAGSGGGRSGGSCHHRRGTKLLNTTPPRQRDGGWIGGKTLYVLSDDSDPVLVYPYPTDCRPTLFCFFFLSFFYNFYFAYTNPLFSLSPRIVLNFGILLKHKVIANTSNE